VLNYGDTVQITIDYRFSGGRELGFLIYPEGYYVGYNEQFDDSVYVEERIAYTHNEPQDARFWLPSNDHPHDKALFTINVRLPKGYNVVSNGLLTEEGEYDAESDYFKWEHKYPMSTYLLAVNASKFHVFNDWYKRVINPEDSIEVVYYVWEKDFLEEKTDGSRYNARNSFKNVIPMMERFSEFFIEYPYEKYGMVAVQPYDWGGMEHQTITTINRSWLRGRSDGGIAHELVHQWFGDMITCASWADLWINEGAATWGEALWSYFWGSDAAYNNNILGKRWGYLYYGNFKYSMPAYDVPSNQLFNYPITYCKSSWIYHMLYKMLGEEAFRQILRNMLNEYAYQPISSQQFIDHVKNSIDNPPQNLVDIIKVPPFSIDEFFDQWLYHPGHPIYDMTVDIVRNPIDNEKYDVNITMEQKQNFPDVPELFKTLIRFDILQNDNGNVAYHKEEFYNDKKVQTFTATYDFIPDTVMFDFTYALAEVDTTSYHITSVEENEKYQGFTIFPNPLYSGSDLKILFQSEIKSPMNITIIDMLGNIVYQDHGIMPSGAYQYFNIKTNDLHSGVYNIIISTNEKSFTRKFTIVN
jgi:aminopeptidase N